MQRENELVRRVGQFGVEENGEMKLKRVGFEFLENLAVNTVAYIYINTYI
jgi:hypothetical protein